MGAGEGMLAVEDEAGHAADAGLARALVLGADRLGLGVAGQEGAGFVGIQAGLGGGGGQDLGIADVLGAQEIGVEQRLHDRVLAPLALVRRVGGVADQAVRVDGVGRAFHALEGEVDALGLAGRADLVVDRVGVAGAAELELEILAPVHAAGRHVRVELEGAPVDRQVRLRPLGEGALQPALADEAPGADRVGEDIDVHRKSNHDRGAPRA